MTNEVCAIPKTFTVSPIEPTPPAKKLTFKTPSFVFANKPFKVSGTTEGATQEARIMLEKGVWGIDWAAQDETLKSVTSDGKGKFKTELTFEQVGYEKIYAAQKKEWMGIDWLAGDRKSQTMSIFIIDWWIIGVIGVLILFVMYKKGMLKGITKKGGKK